MNIYGGGQILNTFEKVKYRPMEEKEIMPLFVKLKFNTDFSLPDKLIQDFINDGSIAPTFKKCVHFNNNDFNHIVIHIKKRKNIKKLPPKPSTKKIKKKVKVPIKIKSKSQSQSKTKRLRVKK
jgi:hypothetical protein